jgi:hypothetical protein
VWRQSRIEGAEAGLFVLIDVALSLLKKVATDLI